MKLIKSIVRPNKVDDVKDAVGKLGLSGMTVTEVRGHGKQKGHTAIYRGQEYTVSLLPKMEMEIVVPDDSVDDVVKAIIGAAARAKSAMGACSCCPCTRVTGFALANWSAIEPQPRAGPKTRRYTFRRSEDPRYYCCSAGLQTCL